MSGCLSSVGDFATKFWTPIERAFRKFGKKFSEALLKTETGSWKGPIRSGFGLHLVFINEHIEGRVPELDEVRDVVARDWSAEKRKEIKVAIIAKKDIDFGMGRMYRPNVG